ncbi:MAG: c-type cytochrome domain-containing protein [Chloroflexota bacterium]
MFALHCGLCHGEMGGLALDSYSGLMAGGRSGSAVVAGNPD